MNDGRGRTRTSPAKTIFRSFPVRETWSRHDEAGIVRRRWSILLNLTISPRPRERGRAREKRAVMEREPETITSFIDNVSTSKHQPREKPWCEEERRQRGKSDERCRRQTSPTDGWPRRATMAPSEYYIKKPPQFSKRQCTQIGTCLIGSVHFPPPEREREDRSESTTGADEASSRDVSLERTRARARIRDPVTTTRGRVKTLRGDISYDRERERDQAG